LDPFLLSVPLEMQSTPHTSIWSDPSKLNPPKPVQAVMPAKPPAPLASPVPAGGDEPAPPLSVPAASGDVFADAVQELKDRMEHEKAEIAAARASLPQHPSPPTVPVQGSAAVATAPSQRRVSSTTAISEDELLRVQSDKERVERQEREVRMKLDERLKHMQAEAMRLCGA
jgi:hypothetical protein